ncbi:MAG: hypothetical protein ACI4FY_00970 [Acetatifactor sp.]
MKKLVVMMLTGVMVFSLAACGGKDEITQNSESSVESSSQVESSVEESSAEESSTEENSQESEDAEAVETEGAAGILNAIWEKVDPENRFAVAGGGAENSVMGSAGSVAVTEGELIDSMLGFPADKIELIDDAASLMHMMNANTFTGGAYHLADPEQMDEVAKAVKENILNRQWMCGFPEKLVVVSVDEYLITFFGKNDPIANFKTALSEAFENAQIISEDDIE